MSVTCQHLIKDNYLSSLQGKLIYKDQCTKCFHDPRDENGLDVCLKCLNGQCVSGQNHSQDHYLQYNHPIVLNIKMKEKPIVEQEQQDLTKLAIGKPGGAIANQIEYEEIYTLRCKACNIDLDQSQLQGVIQSVKQENSAFKKQDICEWELDIQPCEHTLTLDQIPKDMSQGLSHCHQCDLSTNLWLCLVCGNVGCGRKNYDGTGGNGHAAEHSSKAHHCLVVKLGTITQEGNASLYCYTCDNDVSDLYLQQHLGVFGININEQKKTEKTVAELNIDANRTLTLSSIIEAGKVLKPLFGPKFTGMQNLGNSCYINSVFQTLFSIPEFEEKYYQQGLEHLKSCKRNPIECLTCQFSKLGSGLMSGEYSKKKEVKFLSSVDTSALQEYEKYEQDGVSINDLRAMIGKNHPEFKTKQMQDALEYLQYVFDQIEKEEKNTNQKAIGKIFEFKTVNKLKCMKCNGVKLIENKTNEYKLPVLPPSPEQLQQALKEQQERQQKLSTEQSKDQPPKEDAKLLEEPEYHISFDDCLNVLKQGEVVELNCSRCGTRSNFVSKHYFKTLPNYLIVPTNRLYLENWVPKKLNAIISMLDEFDFKDLCFTGLSADETLLENQKDNGNNNQNQGEVEVQVDEIALLQIMEMGFGENRSKRALIQFKNNTEAAMNYLFEKMDDPSLDLPIESANKKGGFIVNEENLMLLQQMGFEVEQCKRALQKFNNNVELALDGLSMGEYYEEIKEEGQMEEEIDQNQDQPISSTKFSLQGAIVHIGKSVHSGHYVTYVKRDNQWIYYNDAKVAQAEDPALGKGYIYLFKLKNN